MSPLGRDCPAAVEPVEAPVEAEAPEALVEPEVVVEPPVEVLPPSSSSPPHAARKAALNPVAPVVQRKRRLERRPSLVCQ